MDVNIICKTAQHFPVRRQSYGDLLIKWAEVTTKRRWSLTAFDNSDWSIDQANARQGRKGVSSIFIERSGVTGQANSFTVSAG